MFGIGFGLRYIRGIEVRTAIVNSDANTLSVLVLYENTAPRPGKTEGRVLDGVDRQFSCEEFGIIDRGEVTELVAHLGADLGSLVGHAREPAVVDALGVSGPACMEGHGVSPRALGTGGRH